MNKKILVIWDIILDRFIYGKVERLNPESPSPLLNVTSEEHKLWWAANVAANIAALGGNVVLCWKIWNDVWAQKIEMLCQQHTVQLFGIHSSTPTIVKHRYIELTYRQQLLRTDWEQLEKLTSSELTELGTIIEKVKPEIIILSDYKKWCITDDVAKLCLETQAMVIVDSKLHNPSIYTGAYILKPNFKEFSSVMDIHESNTDAVIEKYGPVFASRFQTNVVITRSEKWASLVEKDGTIHHYAPQAQEVFDVTGAGDTFIAWLATYIWEWQNLQSSVQFANTASSIAVSRVGTTIVNRKEIS